MSILEFALPTGVVADYSSSVDATLYPPKVDLLIKATWEYIPLPILRLADYLPLKDIKRISRIRSVFDTEAKKLLKDKTDRLIAGKQGQKDVMSILGGFLQYLSISTV